MGLAAIMAAVDPKTVQYLADHLDYLQKCTCNWDSRVFGKAQMRKEGEKKTFEPAEKDRRRL